jgi:hypothetical protein
MDSLATWIEGVEVIDGWRCIGCGRVEASRPCLGICQDRRAQLVELGALVAAIEHAERSEARIAKLMDFVRLVATTRAKAGGEEKTLSALRGRAQALLANLS